ncbi:hypothetical protein K505DRAFT_323808, partial [Melanomma pulvis-pyrius CBS 109.77]
MMDDVVGLVMVQVISNLGTNFNTITVVRPILVSLAFAILVPLACSFLLKPITLSLNHYRQTHPAARISTCLQFRYTALAIHTALLVALVAGASYAGTSNLFAAYIAGATISWWDNEVPHPTGCTSTEQANPAEERTSRTEPTPGEYVPLEQSTTTYSRDEIHGIQEADVATRNARTQPTKDLLVEEIETTGTAVYERYYQQPVSRILQTFFFASIGFSIPISRMFSGDIVWRGIVYAMLMTLGKLVCGLWLVRFSVGPVKYGLLGVMSKVKLLPFPYLWGKTSTSPRTARMSNEFKSERGTPGVQPSAASTNEPSHTPSPPHPFSLQPSLILALAMTARGEIGFLISAVAESGGVFASATDRGSESDIFLVVTWAIVLCTIIGPLGAGFCVRRVRALEERKEQEQEGAGRDVLGVWGVG